MEMNKERVTYRIKEGTEQVLREKTPEETKRKLLGQIFTSRSKYERFMSLLRLLKSSLPKALKISEGTVKQLFYHSEHLPFDPERFDFDEINLGNGAQVRVYLLRSKTGGVSMAIKVFRPKDKTPNPSEFAAKLKQERKEIEDLYSSIPDLVPEEHYIVMEDPFKKGRAAATIIEEFLSGEISDIFSFSPEELSRLATDNPIFKNQLVKFIEITLQNELDNGEVVDIFGPKNLIAVHAKDGSFRLILLDPHNRFKTKRATNTYGIMAEEKLGFLKKVLSLIER